jgi:hypothetical protein
MQEVRVKQEHNHILGDSDVIGGCIVCGKFLCKNCSLVDDNQYYCKACSPNKNKILKFILGNTFYILCFIPFIAGLSLRSNVFNIIGDIFFIIAIVLLIFRKKIGAKIRLKM